MLKLYNFHASSTSYRARIVLNLKGLAYEYIPIRLDRAAHLGAAYGEINPMRGVPPLLPKDAVGRAHVRALADIVGADMHPVNNLRIRNFIRDRYKQDAEGAS